MILDKMGRLDDALLYYSKSLILAKDLNNTYMQATILNNIADTFKDKRDLDKAFSYYKESLGLQTNEEEKAAKKYRYNIFL